MLLKFKTTDKHPSILIQMRNTCKIISAQTSSGVVYCLAVVHLDLRSRKLKTWFRRTSKMKFYSLYCTRELTYKSFHFLQWWNLICYESQKEQIWSSQIRVISSRDKKYVPVDRTPHCAATFSEEKYLGNIAFWKLAQHGKRTVTHSH